MPASSKATAVSKCVNQNPATDQLPSAEAATVVVAANLGSAGLPTSTSEATDQRNIEIKGNQLAEDLMYGDDAAMTGKEMTNGFFARRLLPNLPEHALENDDALAKYLFAEKGDRVLTPEEIKQALEQTANPGVSIIQVVKNQGTGTLSVLCQNSSNPFRGEVATTSSGRIELAATVVQTELAECREEMNAYGDNKLVKEILSGLEDKEGADISLLNKLPKTREDLLDAIVKNEMGFVMVYVAPKTIEMPQTELEASLGKINENLQSSNQFNPQAVKLHILTGKPNLQSVFKKGDQDPVENHVALQGKNLANAVELINYFFEKKENCGGVKPDVVKDFQTVDAATNKMLLAEYLEIICDASEMNRFVLRDVSHLSNKKNAWVQHKAEIERLKSELSELDGLIKGIKEPSKLVGVKIELQTSEQETQESGEQLNSLQLEIIELGVQKKNIEEQIKRLKNKMVEVWGDNMNLDFSLDLLVKRSNPNPLPLAVSS